MPYEMLTLSRDKVYDFLERNYGLSRKDAKIAYEKISEYLENDKIVDDILAIIHDVAFTFDEEDDDEDLKGSGQGIKLSNQPVTMALEDLIGELKEEE